MVKLIYCLHRLPHLSREEFQRYWREHHGPLVVSFKDAMHLRRYVQATPSGMKDMEAQRVPSADPNLSTAWRTVVGKPGGFCPARAKPGRQQSNFDLDQDERKFIDLARSPVWLAEEFPSSLYY